MTQAEPRSEALTLTTLAFFSALVCFPQRSCVRGRTVEIALDSESLLLLHVAPWSFRPVRRCGDGAEGVQGHTAQLTGHPQAQLGRSGQTLGTFVWKQVPQKGQTTLRLQLTCDPKAARIKGGTLGGSDIDFEAELLQGPAVGLCHILSGGSDVGLRHKQATQAHVDVLYKQPHGKESRSAPALAVPSAILKDFSTQVQDNQCHS